MKSMEALRVLEDIAAAQWGMVTTAQAGALGVPRLTLSRLVDSGHLERLANGVYRSSGAPSDRFEDLRAAWLSTDPGLRAEERLDSLSDGVVVAGTSAAWLHGVGDLWADRHEFVSSRRRQTQRAEIRYRRRQLDSGDITLVEGLPVMTLERMLADLLDDVREMSLVADALGAAAKKRPLDLRRMRVLFAPLAERNGFKRDDGTAVLEHLLVLAGLDLDSIAHRVSADRELSARVLDNHLRTAKASIDMATEMTQVFTQLKQEVSLGRVQGLQNALQSLVKIDEELRRSLADVYTAGLGEKVADALGDVDFADATHHWTKMFPALDARAARRRLSAEALEDRG
ncbi:hypothetical protein EJO69_08035 [Flaviflexus salsibiostraticola]|uniref:AbiEi antitoxin N-terminal domain-containing protein n=1 Tax=Flaviflexus salsibiostraticola TaxID=1282737 RepID=A0A3Q8WU24_9ACTO|nr:type IV toxin-antitoxin system AbiEi family antitoxin domain-containing protein [Flaviflexus salsibiostraticola]AZN30260.1 hypothetical protein EJO69_08035 [Flaviflexus salsibiostraticola]